MRHQLSEGQGKSGQELLARLRAMPPASSRDEPTCGTFGGSLAAMFWIYPKADAGGDGLAKFLLCNRTPEPRSGLQKGLRVEAPTS